MHLADAYAKLTSLFPDTPQPLFTEALLLVAGGGVEEDVPGTYRILGTTTGDNTLMTVEAGACDCDPLATERQLCAHVLAAELSGLLGKTAEKQQQSSLDSPLLERHVEKVVSGAMMTEAPYSVNVSVEDTDGYQFQFTVRKQDGKEFFQATLALRGWLKEQHLRPKQWKALAQGMEVHGNHTETPGKTKTPETTVPRTDGSVLRFHAETLLRNEMGGKLLWAIQGPDIPRYNAKYGMRVWPEVLIEAGFDMDTLENTRSTNFPSLKGWVAEYVNKPGEDKPDKVTRLAPQN